MRNVFRLVLPLFLVACGASASLAGSTSSCPTASNGGSAYVASAGTLGSCNLVITYNANGSISTTLANPNAYDGVEDQLIGVVNNGPKTITSIALTNPGSDIFGFDGDGICSFTLSPSTTCNFDATSGNYAGSALGFSSTNFFDVGTVNFAGITTGSTGYFSLEGPASLNLVVGQTPEPESWMLLGVGLFGLAFVAKRSI